MINYITNNQILINKQILNYIITWHFLLQGRVKISHPCFKMAPRIAKLESALARADGTKVIYFLLLIASFTILLRTHCYWSTIQCFRFTDQFDSGQ